jgi:tetratricopeptide (TPR) repeat protein
MNNLVMVLQKSGRLEEAEVQMRELLERMRRSFSENHPNTLLVLGNLTRLLEQQQRDDEALATLRELYQRGQAAELSPAQKALYATEYGKKLIRHGRLADAEEPLRAAQACLDAAGLRTSSGMQDTMSALAALCERTVRLEEAREFSQRAQAIKSARNASTTKKS